MPAEDGLVSSPKSPLIELTAILSRSLWRTEDGLLAALVPFAGDPVLNPALLHEADLVWVLLILFALRSYRNIYIVACAVRVLN